MLTIDAVHLREINMPLAFPFETSFGRTTMRRILLVEVESEGLTAWGECVAGEHPYYSDETVDTAWLMTEQELVSKEQAHRRAVIAGQENPVTAYVPGKAPPDTESVVIHFLIDGFSAFGNVWMRGQEIEVWPGHPRWREAQSWILLDVPGQYRRFGRQVFGQGPWPWDRSYTAGVGHFQYLKTVSGEGVVSQPTEEELARADEAEKRRGRRVPMPMG